MTTNYTDTEKSWTANPAPVTEDAAVTVSAWTSDDAVARLAAELESTYGDRHEMDTQLRLFRTQLRAAAMATAATTADTALVIRSVLDGGVDELVTANTTDAELDVLVTAAEAGYGRSIPGLRRELELLREGEREDRTSAPWIGDEALPKHGSYVLTEND
ncbi:hypothetical protein [Mycobacteroides abscessus]|uniref:hypothetical protein n=1 Tax=Mycobacteroides abscessus TaxID=36809 RepID=UPI001877E217|nr:hypothetical protein [Mycobacteroides abscessus]